MNFDPENSLTAAQLFKTFNLGVPRTQCYLCGVELEKNVNRTRDHVPPEGLFPLPLPSDLITVPACRKCNNSKCVDEEFFRLIATTGERPIAEAVNVWNTRVVGSTLKKGRCRPQIEALRRTFQQVPIVEHGVERLAEAFTVPAEFLKRMAVNISRGVIAYLNPTWATHQVPLQTAILNQRRFIELLSTLPPTAYVARGGRTFEFSYASMVGAPTTGMVMFTIFRRIHVATIFDDPVTPIVLGVARPTDYNSGSILDKTDHMDGFI
jgi:hypothetical protein